MIVKSYSFQGTTKIKFYKNIRENYDEMNHTRQRKTFQFEEDTFSKNDQSIGKKMPGVLLLLNFLQIKPHLKYENKLF